jgi:2-methylisocitrate lyase-like PEP mutase family enzyme
MLARCKLFKEAGADGVVADAIPSVEELKIFCQTVPGPLLANNLEGGKTPILKQKELAKMGFAAVSYPLSLLTACIVGMKKAIEDIKKDGDDRQLLMPFDEVCNTVGLDTYLRVASNYKTE